jgi:anti-sigma factor RsiW
MMTCRQCVELLMEYLSGELDEESREHIWEHLKDCPPCIAYVETYQITMQWSRQLTSIKLPADVAARLEVAVERKLRDEGVG